ncbi:hypothetical protein MNBD_GAMMA15-2126 [hydrothermal vent metagenome]|uniref:Uncharacterized protein n=1 Tax=hydrothermal vent metagenome TaxID=652676 RepID=A0A3B0YRT6_9ZZZZ
MMQSIFGLVLLACLCQIPGPVQAEAPADDKTLILNTAVSEPLSNTSQTGFLDSLLGIALQRLGYRLETVRIPAERALIVANDGINDGEMLRIGGLQKHYPNLIQVPEKILDLEFVAFTRNASLQINDWEDLATLPVAVITGWKIFEQNIPASAELVSVKNADQLFTLLVKNRTDVILYSRWSGLAYIRKHQLQNINIVEKSLAQESMYVYLHERHRKLVPLLASELRALKTDGEYQRLFTEILLPCTGG